MLPKKLEKINSVIKKDQNLMHQKNPKMLF